MDMERVLALTVNVGEIAIETVLDDSVFNYICPYSSIPHEHNSHELYYIESGSLTFSCNQTEYSVHTGDMAVISAGTTHCVMKESPDLKRFAIRFNFLKSGRGIDPSAFAPISIRHMEDRTIQSAIEGVRRFLLLPGETANIHRVKAFLELIIIDIVEQLGMNDSLAPKKQSLEEENYMKLLQYTKIDKYLYNNCHTNMILEDLADHFHYSRSQIKRLIYEYSGVSFSEKLRDIRIRIAKHSLSESSMPIDEIALRCGYESRRSFEAMFVKNVGQTPYEYRKSHSK